MLLKRRLFSNMFLRNMVADLFGRSAYSKTPGIFIPYFQYKIGAYQSNQYLYFPTEPYTRRYHNEIFNKLYEYKGCDIINYLDFHYSAYQEKQDFLRFLQYEVSSRLKRKTKETRLQKLQFVSEWISEKQQELKTVLETALKQEILLDQLAPANHNGIEIAAHNLVEYISPRMEQIMDSTEKRMEALTGSLVSGNIELYNQNHEEKLIQLFKLLQTVQAPPHIAKAEQVFKKFSDTDIASILRLHFTAFKDRRLNTIQVKIRDGNERLNDKNPKVQKLEEALQDFFYG